MTNLFRVSAVLAALVLLAWPAQAQVSATPDAGAREVFNTQDIMLAIPVQCRFGSECFIQQYMDWQPGPEAKDYRCGDQAYADHGGTDFRLRDLKLLQRGVPVIASAPGIVVAVRDGMDDAIRMSEERKAAFKGKACGNGVVIAHGKGWRTQYCHMRQGSLAVRKNQKVARGQILGLVGSSGNSEFPHLHFNVFHGDKRIDPFVGRMPNGQCFPKASRTLDNSLWAQESRVYLTYQRSAIMDVGFTTGALDTVQVLAQPGVSDPRVPALVAYGNMINVEKGDVVSIALDGPEGRIADGRQTLEKPQATRLIFAGKRREGERWPPGRYVATLQLSRNGEPVLMDQAVMVFE